MKPEKLMLLQIVSEYVDLIIRKMKYDRKARQDVFCHSGRQRFEYRF